MDRKPPATGSRRPLAPPCLRRQAALLVLVFASAASASAEHRLAELGSLVDYPGVSASATVISLDDADLSARISATVEDVIRDVGEEVKKGDVLLRLECDDYRLAVAIAAAERDAAIASRTLVRNHHNRVRQLLASKLASPQDADSAEASYSQAAAQARRAEAVLDKERLNQSRCNITAPFDGVVKARHIGVGQLAVPGAVLLGLTGRHRLEVSAKVSEPDAANMAAQTAFVFRGGGGEYPLALARTVSAIDPMTRTREIRLLFTADRPLPGTAGKVYWHSAIPHLPPRYLSVRDDITGFFVAEAGRARFVPLANSFPGRAQPVSLPLDTLVVVSATGRLEDGDPLTLSPQGEAP